MSSPTTTSNATTVAELYAAFGRGDIAAILDRFADDARLEDWADNTAQRSGVGHLQSRRGPAGMAEFLASIADWTVGEFSVLDVIGDGRQVVVEARVAWTLPNGRELTDEELHLWTFDDAGRVARLRHYVDTAKHIAATR
jgi:uncharacterized protein